MNLKLHLILRIILIALVCLLATSAYVLKRNDQHSGQEIRGIADSLAKQLELQLLRINAGFGDAQRFPDFDLWQQTASIPGLCVYYSAANAQPSRTICTGSKPSSQIWPKAFALGYRWLFRKDIEYSRSISFKNTVNGTLRVTADMDMIIGRAWQSVSLLVGLTGIMILAVCSLVYLSISRALQPALTITTTLERMRHGDLNLRLPEFEILEWQCTATAINQLANTQQQLLNERQQFASQLMSIQEEDRRYLARELHDELGQCLTAINAIAASAKHSATRQCPELVTEIDRISAFTQQSLDGLRNLLLRLRPVELEQLGLALSLDSLVSEANNRANGSCRYQLNLQGDCSVLPEPIALTIYRITQECLTNIAKHAQASSAQINLSIAGSNLSLLVQDNGISTRLPFPKPNGMGLLGVRERVTALGGQLNLSINQPSGLVVQCRLPISL